MTTTPPDTSAPQGPAPDSGPRVTWEDIRDLARIRRSRTDRRVAGVAGGLGRHLDIDPVLCRVAFVVLTFFGGVGLLLYVALWLLLPEDGKDWATIKLDRRSRSIALIVIGVFAVVLLASHGWWGTPGPVFFLAAIVGVIVVATQLTRRDRPPYQPPWQGQPGQPGQPGQSSQPGQQWYGVQPGATPPADVAATPGEPVGPAPYAASGPASGPATYPASGPPWSGGSLSYAPPPVDTRRTTPSYAVPEQPRPSNPRKRGPILFWFAIAVMAVALGTLGIADLAGADIAPSAYPATVLALSAAFLLIGSFFGRAGGLILVGLLASATTIGATVADRWDPHTVTVVPVTAAAVQDTYTMDVGEIVVDLTSVSDPQDLDGREVHVTGNVGHLDIQVPPGITVVARTHVTGIGGINAFGRDGGGVGTRLTSVHDAGPNAPRLTIDADLHIGGIDVHTEPSARSLR